MQNKVFDLVVKFILKQVDKLQLKTRLFRKDFPQFWLVLSINLAIIVFEFVYTALRFKYINAFIPLWYTKPWGLEQLAPKIELFVIPAISVFLLTLALVFAVTSRLQFLRFGSQLSMSAITTANVLLAGALVRIIKISSLPLNPLLDPKYVKLIFPFTAALLIAYFISPRFIEFAKKMGVVTDPNAHQHPGMVLVKPSARGGGIIFAISFIVVSLIFVPVTKEVVGIIFAVAFTAVIGFLDDITNTIPKTKLKIFGMPLFRLFILQPISVLIILSVGISANFIGNPFDGTLFFNKFTLSFGAHQFAPIAIAFTFLWIIWIINMLSFSNGVDGQYSGIVGIAAIVISILALRFLPREPNQLNTAKLAIIAAGASFGLIPFTWHPSKIMWGFGSTAAGLVLATLSIITGSKIATSIIVLLIPFLDALITAVRRILQGKAPYKGDRGHLHHLLMERGWSAKKIAVFYWISTAVLGTIALASSEKSTALVALTLAGVIAFILILLNLQSELKKRVPQKAE